MILIYVATFRAGGKLLADLWSALLESDDGTRLFSFLHLLIKEIVDQRAFAATRWADKIAALVFPFELEDLEFAVDGLNLMV